MAATARAIASAGRSAIVVVVFYALFPVSWIVSLSLKTPATVSDGKLHPETSTFDNYNDDLQASDSFTRRAASTRSASR